MRDETEEVRLFFVDIMILIINFFFGFVLYLFRFTIKKKKKELYSLAINLFKQNKKKESLSLTKICSIFSSPLIRFKRSPPLHLFSFSFPILFFSSVPSVSKMSGVPSFPPSIQFMDEVGSTMEEAKKLLLGEEKNKAFGVVAETQVKGRGSGERHWVSPRGNLYVTLAIPENKIPTQILPVMPLVVGIACQRAVQKLIPSLPPKSIGTKWPNDLVFNHEKMGGSIIENAEGSVLVGIGINVHLAPPVTDDGRNSTCLDAVLESLKEGRIAAAAGGRVPETVKINSLAMTLWDEFFGLLSSTTLSRHNVIEEFDALMDKSLTLFRRLPTGRDTTPLKAIELNEWGHLKVQAPDGKEETLSAEYLF